MSSSDNKRIVVTRRLDSQAMEDLDEKVKKLNCELYMWNSDEPMPRDELLKKVSGASGILCMLSDKIDSELLNTAGDSLKTISTYSVGFDHIDLEECKRRNITVGNTPRVLARTTAEMAFALMLSASRRVPEATNEVKTGGWKSAKPHWLLGYDVAESTVGIVGMGDIGSAFAQMCTGFRPKRILYTSRNRKEQAEKEIGGDIQHVDMDTLLKESDFVSVHCPLTSETHRLFGAEAFEKMKSSAVFVNTSRGPVVDQEALYDALKNQKIFSAGLDVTEPEPLPTDHKLLSLPNCVISPHIGSATVTTRRRMAFLAGDNVVAGVAGDAIPHQVV